MRLTFLPAFVFLLSTTLLAQSGQSNSDRNGMHHDAAVPSVTLALTGLDGTSRTLSSADLKAMPHVTVTVTNGHSHAQESYSGVPVRDLLATVAASKIANGADPAKPKGSPRLTTIVVAQGTDKYRVVLTLCDTDPGCRSGKAIVADTMNNQPLTADGAFKLILTEDKMPARWVRNLNALTEQNLGPI